MQKSTCNYLKMDRVVLHFVHRHRQVLHATHNSEQGTREGHMKVGGHSSVCVEAKVVSRDIAMGDLLHKSGSI